MKILYFSDMQVRGNDFAWKAHAEANPFHSKMTEAVKSFGLVAQVARMHKPDLIVHMGDLYEAHSMMEIPL